MFIVYKLTNNAIGKSYIGISGRDLDLRWSEHLSRMRSGKRDSRLHVALAKYGPDFFRREVIDSADSEEAVRALETKYIEKYDTYRRGYNCNLGGCGFLDFPDEIKRKMSAAQKGKIIPIETREKMSRAKLGKSSCAINFGSHTERGSANPRASLYVIRFPDGTEHTVVGIREFCRRNCLSYCKLSSRGFTKGYVVLKRFNGHSRKGSTPKRAETVEALSSEGQDMVCSAR